MPDPEAASDGGRPLDETVSADGKSEPDAVASNRPSGLSEYLTDLREGISSLRGTFVVPMLVGSVVINFALGATIAVLPSYGAHVGGAEGYGFLMAAFAIGLLLGALAASGPPSLVFSRLSVAAYLLPVSPGLPRFRLAGCPRLSPCSPSRSPRSESQTS